MTTYETLEVTHNGAVIDVMLNRPERLNAVDLTMLQEFTAVMTAINEDEEFASAKVVVVRGAGNTLCAGADLGRVSAGQDPVAIMAAAKSSILSVVQLRVPVITALTGKSAGFGASLALASDITVMADDGALVMAFVHIGLMCDGGMSYLLPALIGNQRAARALFLGDSISAQNADALGMVAEVCAGDQVMQRVNAIAEALSQGAAEAISATKRALNVQRVPALEAALDAEAAAQVSLLQSDEFMTRVQAFFAKKRG